MTVPAHFNNGDVVQLRSGGPLLTVDSTDAEGDVQAIYYNNISGLYEKFITDQRCLKSTGNLSVPADVRELRHTSVTKSTLS